MGILVFAVPGLLVVVLGYAIGHGLAGSFGASPGVSEAVGWGTGLVLLVVVVAALWRWRRWRRRRRR